MRAAESGELEMVNKPEERRWHALLDGKRVGYVEYRLSPGRVSFIHTVVAPDYQGHGIARQLARAVLDDAVARGLRISPYCPYIRSYLERHHEYDAQVDPVRRPPAEP